MLVPQLAVSSHESQQCLAHITLITQPGGPCKAEPNTSMNLEAHVKANVFSNCSDFGVPKALDLKFVDPNSSRHPLEIF